MRAIILGLMGMTMIWSARGEGATVRTIAVLPNPSLDSAPVSLVAGTGGDLYFNQVYSKIAHIAHDGRIGSIEVSGSMFLEGILTGSDGTLYTWSAGTIYQVAPTGETTVIGVVPRTVSLGEPGIITSLSIINDGAFIGTALDSGTTGDGSIFRMDRTGKLSTVFSFGGAGAGWSWNPESLIQGRDGNFYGKALVGVQSWPQNQYAAVIYKVTPDGIGSIIYESPPSDGDYDITISGLTQAQDGNLYGVISEEYGGTSQLFRLTQEGIYTSLHDFASAPNRLGYGPVGPLVINPADGNIYGLCEWGGTRMDDGVLYECTADGKYRVLHDFGNGTHGKNPTCLTRTNDGRLYCITSTAGRVSKTVFLRISRMMNAGKVIGVPH